MTWLLMAVLGVSSSPPAATRVAAPVYVLELEGAIQPAAQRYLARGLREAADADAALMVVQLDTPGGLLVSLREMTTMITRSRVPVAVYVAPAGARAASAGFFLLMAADVAAMAPGTNTGAAHPVALGPQQADDTSLDKAAQDAAALVRALAGQRERSVQAAEQAVMDSRAFAASEALERDLIEYVATDLRALLRQLDGAQIRRFDGRAERLALAEAPVEQISPTWAERLLRVVADPQIAYLLLLAGILGLAIELIHPGGIVPGVIGAISLLLAFYAMSVLPVNWIGALLIALGIGLLVAEAFVTSYGLLALAGIGSFVLGSLVLVDSKLPGMRLGLELVLPSALALGGMSLLLVSRALRLRRTPPRTGVEGMVGEVGEVVVPIADGEGKVFVHGEYWAATADAPLPGGTRVRVQTVDGRALKVAAAEPRRQTGEQ